MKAKRRATQKQTLVERLTAFDEWWDENHDSDSMRSLDPHTLCVGWMAAQGISTKASAYIADVWSEGLWRI